MAARRTRGRGEGVSFEALREIALALPGMQEGSSYGTPGFRVRGKLVARMHQEGDSLVVLTEIDEKEALLEADPAVYHTTPHYDGHGAILVRLAKVKPDDLAGLLELVWRRRAPKKLVAELEARG